jgi:uncharacterized protein with NRDE domain
MWVSGETPAVPGEAAIRLPLEIDQKEAVPKYNAAAMCLIFVALDVHPKYPVIIAANRDEFYDRPTAPAAFWPENPELLAGRDLRAGGTWLGITRTGRIAALTNYRDPHDNRPDAPSRGLLVTGFLLSEEPPSGYLDRLANDASSYNGFNFLAGQNRDFYWYSNRGDGIQKLSPGIHGLSNRLIDTPWPKVEKGKRKLEEIASSEKVTTEDFFQLLSDRTMPADERLPDTGVGLEWERILAPMFISSPTYGTRSSTVILLDRSGRITFEERCFANGGNRGTSSGKYSFPLS